MREYFEKIYKKGMDSFQKELYLDLKEENKRFVITANPETLMIGKNNKDFDQILKDKNVSIVPDGIGVVKAGQFLEYNIKERVTGVEICKFLLESANLEEKSIYLFGAKNEVLQQLVKKIHTKYPLVKIVGYRDGYVKNREEVFEDIIQKAPDIVLVALGIPYQEMLIHQFYNKFDKGIFVGVGGSFDVLSGMKKRAPQIFIKLNLEWLYRIACEPKRLGRFFRSNVKFIVHVVSLKLKK